MHAMEQKSAIGTKSAGGDVAAAFDDFYRSFEAFKDTNDDRLSQIETRLSADVLTEEKLTRIDRSLDEPRAVWIVWRSTIPARVWAAKKRAKTMPALASIKPRFVSICVRVKARA